MTERETMDHGQASLGELPQFIGQYRVLERIGEGGMGDVYLCEQIHPIRRRVAVKVLRHGMNSANVVERFKAERQMLALMTHPNIARMLDAGETDQGLPYFVMEYVPGVALVKYCRERRTGVRGRIELLISVCAAVQHAHQKGFVHQDLKPSNILVTEVDGHMQPKVIDFGIARAVTGPRAGAASHEEFVGSPAYMSPEQADASAGDIDTRSDIYSLGVILHELLTARTPLDARAKALSLSELQHLLRTHVPQPPSRRIREHADAAHANECGCSDARALEREVRNELDWITMKALARDPAQRYATASDLAADLQRFLDRQPVMAARPGRLYAIRKLSERHRAAVMLSVMMTATLLAFTAYSGWQAYALREERDRANRETLKATEITEFMVDLFALADPQRHQGQEITVRQAIDIGARRIESELGDQPDLQSELLYSVGQVYRELGDYDNALHVVEQALQHAAVTDPELHLALQLEKAEILYRMERFADADRLYGETIAAIGDTPHSDRQLLDKLRYGLARNTRARDEIAEAARMFARVRASLEARNEQDTVLYALTLYEQAQDLYYRGNAVGAEQYLKIALSSMESARGLASLETAKIRGWLMHVLAQQNRHAEAEALGRENLRILEDVYGSSHEIVARACNNLAMAIDDLGKYEEAERLYLKALAILERERGPESDAVLTLLGNLGGMLLGAERFADAERVYRRAGDIATKITDEDSPKAADVWLSLAHTLALSGRAAEALPYIERHMPGYLERYAAGSWIIGYLHEVRGAALLGVGRLPEARAELDAAKEIFQEQFGATHAWTTRLEKLFVRLRAAEQAAAAR